MTNRTLIKELGLAIIELKAGRYEEVYRMLTDLKDELTQKELSSSDQTER